MRSALKLFGPDADGVAADGPLGLAWTQHCGFTPQDRAERQPMIAEDGAMIVFAGRLDHREELSRALDVPVGRRSSIPDGELVRLAWQRWGVAATRDLYGEYSILVADPKRRRITGLRGPLRSPPLYYHDAPDRLVLASSQKGLFALGDIPRELDEQQVADALVLNYGELAATMFRGIAQLPLGHVIEADPAGTRIRRFYTLGDTAPLRLSGDRAYEEAAAALLEDAVRDAMRSVETPAIALSSGLDSTTVAVTALPMIGPDALPLLGLTSIPEAGWSGRTLGVGTVGDESAPVRALAARYPALDVRFLSSAGLALDHGLDRLQMAADMPLRGAGGLYWGLDLNRMARGEGRRVMLSGASGNATISYAGANQAMAALFRSGRWVQLIRALRRGNRIRGDMRFGGLAGLPAAILPNMPAAIGRAYRAWRPPTYGGHWHRYAGIHLDYARTMRVDDRIAGMAWDEARIAGAGRRDRMVRMMEGGWRGNSGAATMAFQAVTGVQARDPLGDRKLAEFCHAIPDDQFYRDGVDRWLVRRLMADRLPPEVLQAPIARQGADWLVRLRRDAERYDAELVALAGRLDMAARLDIPRLRAALAALTADGGTGPTADQMLTGMLALPRALGMASFIRSVDGRND